jgi:hypothetical protein
VSAPHQQPKPPSLSELAGTAAFAVGLISAWLYATGWTYAYHYFDRFGIPLLMVDIPKENYFVYGGVVLRKFAVWGLLILCAGVLLFALWRRVGPLLGRWALPLGMLAVLALFWLGHAAGVAVAHEQYRVQRESDYSGYPRVQLWSKENAEPPAGFPPVSDALASGCYRLLLHNKERLFLTRPFKGAGAADLPVLILPWDQIALVRVLPEYTSCK